MLTINTINIAPQETISALDTAMTTALGEALNWEHDEYSVWYPESGLCFRFNTNSNNIALGVGGGGAYEVPFANRQIVAFDSTKAYCMDYLQNDNFVALGIRKADDIVCIPTMILKNELNEIRAIMPDCTSARLFYFIQDGISTTEIKTIDLPTNNSKCATSILKLPDIYSGTMFKDVYIEYSCPYLSTDKMYYIGGKYYRHIGFGGKYGGLAVPLE